MTGWLPSSVAPCTWSGALEQVACFGHMQDLANSNVREATQILQALNPVLRRGISWRAFLWCLRHHWAVVLRPDDDQEAFEARSDSEYIRRGADLAEPAEMISTMPSSQLHVVFELRVAPDEHDFFLQLSIFPNFKSNQANVHDFGSCGPLGLEEVSEHAIEVISHYRTYGLIGCNCQHFALDLFRTLGVETHTWRPEDQRIEEAAVHGVRAYSVGVGVGKGVVSTMAAVAAGTGGVGLAFLSAHVVAGCVVGFAAGAAVKGGYQWLCRHHRQKDAKPDPDGH